MKFLAISVLLLCVALANPLPQSSDFTADPPSQITVEFTHTAGNGCPEDITIGSDGKTLTVVSHNLTASVVPGVPEDHKSCMVYIQLRYASNLRYSITTTSFRGHVDLDEGVTGTESAVYQFQGSAAKATAQADFKGPISEDYLRDKIPVIGGSAVVSPCGKNFGGVEGTLGIAAYAGVNSPNSKGKGSLGPLSSSVGQGVIWNIGIQWQACK